MNQLNYPFGKHFQIHMVDLKTNDMRCRRKFMFIISFVAQIQFVYKIR